MKKQVLFATAALVGFFQSFSQGDKPSVGQRSFFAELGGPGVLFSANYDTRFKKTNLGFGGRIGVGFVTAYEYDTSTTYYYYGTDRQRSVLTLPLQVNYIFGKPNSPHTFEVGAGITLLSRKIDAFDNFDYSNSQTQFYGTFCFMYRRQPANGGFSWRIGFTPLVSPYYVQASGAAGVGYNF